MAGLSDGESLGGRPWVHLCVDMQRLFWPGSEWGLKWMPRIAPGLVALCDQHAERTIFTRFIPVDRPGEGVGVWRDYYQRWASMTLRELPEGMIELIPALRRFVPPAEVVDKRVYSPWLDGDLEARLRARGCEALVITGGETDICVLSTVIGAVDRGYRILLVEDALCSSSDTAHEATLDLFRRRFSQHVTIIELKRLRGELSA